MAGKDVEDLSQALVATSSMRTPLMKVLKRVHKEWIQQNAEKASKGKLHVLAQIATHANTLFLDGPALKFRCKGAVANALLSFAPLHASQCCAKQFNKTSSNGSALQLFEFAIAFVQPTLQASTMRFSKRGWTASTGLQTCQTSTAILIPSRKPKPWLQSSLPRDMST